MADLDYIDGRSLSYQLRSATTASGELAAHAADLVKAEVDLIVAVLTPAILAAKAATTKIPIVFSGGVPDARFVTNLARPEANLTGIHSAAAMVGGKAVQILADAVPSARSFALLLNTPDSIDAPLQRAVRDAVRARQLEYTSVLAPGRQDLVPAFDELVRRRCDGVVAPLSLPPAECAELAIKYRLPSMSFRREYVEAGGLLSYGSDQAATYRSLASYVDKVLKGTPTSSLPVQFATHFELALNLRTATALALNLPPMFVARADVVIE